MTQEPKHPHNPKKRHPNWGGRRPGAGAPRGNMNALKHGRRSERMARLGMFFAANPKTRAELLAIADRWDRKQMKAEDVFGEIFSQVLERGIKLGEARSGKPSRATPADILDDPSRLFVLPPERDRRSIDPNAPESEAVPTGEPPTKDQKEKSHHPINQAHEQPPTIDQDPNGNRHLIERPQVPAPSS